ncbi:DUF2637 domain-containing protein [Streptomyces sp. NPDC088135]|uniref:DUF2637 domain-containing protein n=1 Tax=Streptomyces sp. NPDC088135 TaxID=3160993 RepID=UPI0034228A13
MTVEKFLLPVGIGFAALCVLGIVALVLRSRRTREQDKLSAEDRERLAEERRKTWRRRLAIISLSVAFVIIFCIAGIAAWLSFGAQKAYAFDRNGGSWNAATGFALLLDAGALGLSLLRLFEALTARSSQLTRLYLVGFIVASATMNLLHAPHTPGESPSLGGRLVAVIPPLVYAVFLETLLKKVEQLILGKYPKRKVKKNVERGYSLLLWVPFVGYPWQMWKKWREDLHDTLQYVRAPGSRKPLPTPAPVPEPSTQEREEPRLVQPAAEAAAAPPPAPRAEAPPAPYPAIAQPPIASAPVSAAPSADTAGQIDGPGPAQAVAAVTTPQPPVRPEPDQTVPLVPAVPGGSSNKPKKDQLRDALMAQILAGDLTVLDGNAQVANGAAYRANMQLGKAAGKGLDRKNRQEGLLADGAVRSTVKQLLPELRQVAEQAERARREEAAAAPPPAPAVEPVPEHRAPAREKATEDEPRERRQGEPVIGHQRAGETSEERETALT